ARLEFGLARVHHTDPRASRAQRVDERPGRTARLHGDHLLRPHPMRDEVCDALARPREATFPVAIAGLTHRAGLKKHLVQINADILSLHGLSSSYGPERACWNHSI